jgi:hypothetical protein
VFRIVKLLLVYAVTHTGLGCQSQSGRVHFIVPNGYRGAVLIYTNQPDGITLEVRDGRYVCEIPETGILRIKGNGPFYKWHSTTASFANGDPILLAHEPERLTENAVAFWSGGSRPGGLVYDFIGTRAENQSFRHETATGEVRPGGVRK